MSHSHIRVPKPAKRDSPWIPIIGTVLIVVLVAWLAFGRLFQWPLNPNDTTADGKILETRIVVDHLRDSQYGGLIYYRIEAQVKYQIQGKEQEQWIAASEATTDQILLAARISSHPKTCLVYWPPNHPDNAKCRLD